MGDAEICACASEALLEEIGEDYFLIYQETGAIFLTGPGEGLAMSDAWDAAVAGVAGARGLEPLATLEITNPIGRAHSDIIEACTV